MTQDPLSLPNGTPAVFMAEQANGTAEHAPLPSPSPAKAPATSVEEEDHATARLHFPQVCYQLRRKLLAFLDESLDDAILRRVQSQVRISMGIIEQALKQYSLNELSLSYNGGKDCLVLLILILGCLPVVAQDKDNNDESINNINDNNTTTTTTNDPPPFQAIYIVPPDPFPEVELFVADSAAQYHLRLARYPVPMRSALDAYLAEHKSLKGIFLGTRRTDPHSEFLTHFTPTDAGWPPFMRIHPIIDWHYAEIWRFIRHLDIPFCSLYNQGFTSLGGTSDTRPNPALVRADDATSYRPAYELLADDEERLGRAA